MPAESRIPSQGRVIIGIFDRVPFKLGMLVLCLITLLLRLPALASRPLWYDEAFSILFSREGPGAMLYGTLAPVEGAAADVHPLLYYTLLWGWMKLFGESVTAVRGLSVLLSVAITPVLLVLTRRLFNPTIALIAGLLYALSPFQVHYGQEARMYILLTLLLVSATYSLYHAMRTGSKAHAILFGVFAALAMYSHVLAVFFLIPLVVVLNLQLRTRNAALLTGQGTLLAVLLYAPWLSQLPNQLAKVRQAYWIEKPGLSMLLQTNLAFTANLPVDEDWLVLLLAASILILVLSIWEGWYAIREGDPYRSPGILVLSLAVIPVVLLYGVSQVRPLYIIRGLLPSAAFYLMAIAWLLIQGRRLASSTIAICLCFAFISGNATHYTYNGFPYAPFAELNDFLREEIEQDSVILHSNKISMLPAYFDDPTLPHRYMQDPPGSGSDTLALPTQEVLGLFAEEDPLAAVGDAHKVYFVFFQQEIGDYARLGFQEHPILSTLKDSFVVKGSISKGDLRLILLERIG